MADKYTEAQIRAINDDSRTIAVSAAAGSGKTSVLVQRVMRKLREGVGFEQMLIVTFTDAAAAEMRAKIGAELFKAISADPKNRELRAQYLSLSSARICTVHSFCFDLLRRNFAKCGLMPDFTVCSEERSNEYKKLAARAVLSEEYETRGADFDALRDTICEERSDKMLEALIIKSYESLQGLAEPLSWLREQTAPGTEEMRKSYVESMLRQLLCKLETAFSRLSAAFERAADAPEPYASAAKSQLSFMSGLLPLLRDGRLSEARARLAHAPTFTVKQSKTKPPELNALIAASNNAKKTTAALVAHCIFDSENAPAELSCGDPAVLRAFCRVISRFSELYRAEKELYRAVDFDDAEHLTLAFLKNNPDAAREISASLSELMVDEYQDTNHVQDEIFRLLAPKDGSSFFVGDVKQSIYRFRNADPAIFTARCKSSEAAVYMNTNFRSGAEVIGLCNHVFGSIMSEELGGIDYTENQKLLPFDKTPSCGKSEFCIIDTTLCKRGDDSAFEAEAAYVASRIREIHNAEGAPYSDFAILLSTVKNKSSVLRAALEREGVPCSVQSDDLLCSTEEATVLISLLSIIDNRRQDIPLLAVLRSPLYSFTPQRLAEIRAPHKSSDFWDALDAAAKAGDEDCARFASALDDFCKRARDMSCSRLLQYIFAQTGMYGIFAALPFGRLRCANLDAVYSLALKCEGGEYLSCGEFAQMLISSNAEIKADSAAGGVAVMTIHKSKGLEFPYVFLCNLSKRFNMDDSRELLLMDASCGLAIPYADREKRIRFETYKKRVLKARTVSAAKSEEVRKLYVAMTRAKRKLFLVCSAAKPSEKIKEAYERCDPETGALSAEVLSDCSSAGAWLLSALVSHPDAALLRAHIEGGTCFDGLAPAGKLSFSMIPFHTIEAREPCLPESGGEASVGEYDEYIRQADFSYPHADICALPSKLTPAALAEKLGFAKLYEHSEASGALAHGLKLHSLLARADLSRCLTADGAFEEFSRLCTDASRTDAEMAAGFAVSALGARARLAERTLREYQFSVLLTPDEIYKNGIKDEFILVNGSIDMLIFEPDGLVVVDFKTDSVRPGAEATAAQKHRPQLELYALAAQKIFLLPVKERDVFFLKTGQSAKV